MQYELKDGEEVVDSVEISDPELSSYMDIEMQKVKELSTEIEMDIEALELKKAKYNFLSKSAWGQFFKTVPEWHPAKKRDAGDYYKYDVATHTALSIKNIHARRGQ